MKHLKHSIPLFGALLTLLILASAFVMAPQPAAAHTERAAITYRRAMPARTLVPGRTPQVIVQNFLTGSDGTLTLNTTQPAVLGTTGTDQQEDVTVTATLDGTVIGTNTVGPFTDTTLSTPLTLSVVAYPVAAGWHRLSVTYSASPVNDADGDTDACTPDPQGCSPIVLSRGRFTLTAPSRV